MSLTGTKLSLINSATHFSDCIEGLRDILDEPLKTKFLEVKAEIASLIERSAVTPNDVSAELEAAITAGWTLLKKNPPTKIRSLKKSVGLC